MTTHVLDIQLNKLLKSPRNARKQPHRPETIEGLAASIAVKGMLQPPVVEPKLDEDGEPSGFYFVTIGEGRRQAQLLRAKRKEIRKTETIRCVIDAENDPHEISLDENVTREDMHPADQFEAFKKLAEERGFGPEEIGARFGVSAHVVRQRLRLGSVAPRLMAVYREGGVTLEQLMAFAVTEDHERQEQVYDGLSWNKSPSAIRRAMTETKVAASDRRAVFVGAEAYAEAGGVVLRDLFTEDGGGWLEDVGLLDRLAVEKLTGLAEDIRRAEGWKWTQAHLDYPQVSELCRAYPRPVERTVEQDAEIGALSSEYDALIEGTSSLDELSPEAEARLAEIDATLEAFGEGYAFDRSDIERGGVLVMLDPCGQPRIERGFIRPQDDVGETIEDGAPDETGERPTVGEAAKPTEIGGDNGQSEPNPSAPLSEGLVAELTAYKAAALRDALSTRPDIALLTVIHALVLSAFYRGYGHNSCLELETKCVSLGRAAPGIEESVAGRSIAERHQAFATRLPKAAADAWAFLSALDEAERMALFAHAAALCVSGIQGWQRGHSVHADSVGAMISLDMANYWTPTAESYFGRVPKARILEAVREGASEEAARRIAGFKKPDMAEEAERLLARSGWLPQVLRGAENA